MVRAGLVLAVALAGLPAFAHGEEPGPPMPPAEALIRAVVKSQRAAEKRLESYTFDQLEETTTYRSDGSAKEVRTKLFYVFSASGGGRARASWWRWMAARRPRRRGRRRRRRTGRRSESCRTGPWRRRWRARVCSRTTTTRSSAPAGCRT